ncbi:SRPBCC domain-containing protein [Cellulomonas sp. HZM]|uniref:SRPBCC domain-containing protein n=1 Tax=Cellulomonas sp. HZM TaxID=1454010 RepID=UPI00068B3F85|nr:SRPBCC domain-containing protein [Cellulomonas sp. HZM]
MSQHDIRRPGATTHTRTGEQSIVHRREFEAPAALVQRAHTEVDLFTQWMGPRGTTVEVDRFEPVTGGAFRYSVVSPDGGAWTFRGTYHDVVPGRIRHTWQYEAEEQVTLETLEFVDLPDGRSALEVTSTYTSAQACEDMLASGMDAGMDEDFERIDALLAALR